MAEKRMFTKKITDSDAFIEMSSAAQALYFHLNQSADDDGFNNQIQMAMFRSHASIDDLKVLMLKNFIIRFESGVIVIKHWWMHNTLRKDRYNSTNFQEELSMLNIKENGAYTISCADGCQMVAERLPQISIDKISIDKLSKEKNSGRFTPPTPDEVRSYCQERNNKVDAERFVDFYASKGWMVGKTKMKDWKACVRTWEKEDKSKPQQEKPKSTNKFNQFPQRDYSDNDMLSMEQRLLSRGQENV
jgi:hypothetical protein